MQELVSSETLNNEEEIIVFEENLKGPKGDKGDKGDDGYTPKKGVDYFTETDKQELIEAVTEDASSEFVQIVNSKTTEFNNNATSKTESFNSNATSKETSYNDNATTKLNEYNENHTSKLNAYNENSAEKLAEYNENSAEKLEEYDEHIEDLDNIVSKNTANGESVYVDDALKYKIFDCKIDGNAKQTTTTGKQMLQMCVEVREANGLTFTKNSDGSVTLNGEATANTYCNLNTSYDVPTNKKYFTLEKGKTYTSYCKNITSNIIFSTRSNSQSTALLSSGAGNEIASQSYEGETDTECYSYLYVRPGVAFDNYTVYPMVCEGSYTELEWEEYTGGEVSPNPDYPQPINVVFDEVKIVQTGKNLIAKQGLSTPLNENDYYDSRTLFLTPGVDGWGHLECNNSSGSSSKYINIFVKKKNIYVKENSKYTLFVELKNVSNLSYLTVNQVVNNDLFQELRGINNGELVSDGIYKFYVTTKEVLSDDMVLRIYTGVPAGNVISFDMRLMILESDWTNKEVEYEAFQSNEYTINLNSDELVKLTDDTKDEITIDKCGNVILTKQVFKQILDGTENWILYTGYQHTFSFSIGANDDGSSKIILRGISDYFSSKTNHDFFDTENGIYFEYTNSIIISMPNINSVEELISWLSENNVTCYYQLLNESETIDLGAIQNFKTFEGVNHFFLETNLATNFEIKYAQDLQKVISKQQEEIDELKTLLSSTATSAMLVENLENDLIEEV